MNDLSRDLVEQGMTLCETHISWVFLARDRVYKVKKPVALGFLDFTDIAARKHFCEREVELNRRLARDVYLGVVPVVRDAGGVHRFGGPGEAVEWAVEMRRLPVSDCADTRLAEGRLGSEALQRIARHLADFHAAARCDAETSRYGQLDVIETNLRENFEQAAQSALRVFAASELGRLEQWQLEFVREQRARFQARIEQRRIRDCHGDVRLEHCYIDAAGTVTIIDCIEFNERFRFGDVCSDVAFLAMDLCWHEEPELAEDLLSAYARAADDYDLFGVVDFYQSYRAFVRGKISSMLADSTAIDSVSRQRAERDARKYYLLSEACTREPLGRSALYVVGGVIASGKSSVAEALGALLHAPVVDADRTRKSMAAVAPTTPLHDAAFSGHYGPEQSARVYEELLRRAAVVLRSGRSVVVDASFRGVAQRMAARELAERCEVPFLFIECSAPDAVCKQRLEQRARVPSVSDGRLAIFDAFVASYEPVTELPPEQYVRVDSSGTLHDSLSQIRSRLD